MTSDSAGAQLRPWTPLCACAVALLMCSVLPRLVGPAVLAMALPVAAALLRRPLHALAACAACWAILM